jgi:hypothetical protein
MNDDNANQVEVGEGPKPADTISQRIVRAREAQPPEALAPSDIESAERLLGDLELGDESDCEVIEHLDELDAYAEDTANVKAEASTAATPAVQVVAGAEKAKRAVTPELRELIRAAHVKYSGGVEVAKGDPLATDKKKIANTLKKVGRTLADLPPDFWMLPRTAKIPGERSRQSELHRVYAEAERPHELEKSGRPANYDRLPVDEQRRIDTTLRQRRHRDKKPKPPTKPTVAPLPVVYIAPDSLGFTLHRMWRSLDAWTSVSSTPLARQLRKPEQQRALIRAAAAYARYFNWYGKPPSRFDLSKGLRWTEDQVRRKLDVLKSLYAPGGPWAGA